LFIGEVIEAYADEALVKGERDVERGARSRPAMPWWVLHEMKE